MKAIFPCLGSLIMTKNDIEELKNYYDSRQLENDDNSTIIVENNFFNYFNNNSKLILDNVTPLTVSKLKKVLGITDNTKTDNNSEEDNGKKEQLQEDEELIDDESIMSNPFFTTLKPVD